MQDQDSKKIAMSYSQFLETFRNLSPGDSFVYHIGNLAFDRCMSLDLEQIANRAYQLAQSLGKIIQYHKLRDEDRGLGQARLFQVRLADFSFKYFIQKRLHTDKEKH